jgi:hypothetical protein
MTSIYNKVFTEQVAVSMKQIVEEWMLSMDIDGRYSTAVFGLFGINGVTKEQAEEALTSMHSSLQKLIKEYHSQFPESVV